MTASNSNVHSEFTPKTRKKARAKKEAYKKPYSEEEEKVHCACCEVELTGKPYITVRGKDDKIESGITLCFNCYRNPKCRVCGKKISIKQAQLTIELSGRCLCVSCYLNPSKKRNKGKKQKEPVKKGRGHYIEWRDEKHGS